MKKKFVYFVILFSAIVLQTSVLPVFFSGRAIGDAVLMLILAGSIIDGFVGFIWWSVFAGIIYDMATYTVVGLHALIFLLVVYFVSFFSRRISVELKGVGLALFMVFVMAATFISRTVMIFFQMRVGQSLRAYVQSFGSLELLCLEIFYDICLFLIYFTMLKKAKNFFALS